MMHTASLVLVTGSSDGIGLETAKALARRGARVLLHGRSAEKLARARSEVALEHQGPVPEGVLADFASLADVRAMASELHRRGEPIDVLVNNAGLYARERSLSADGIERTFAVNHYAPFLLTHLVLSGPSGASIRRIVNVSSVAHARGRVDLDDPLNVKRRFEAYGAYASSKLANVLFSVELARRLSPRRIAVNALHPGVVSTKLLTEGFGMQGHESLAEGAATSVYLALDAPETATGRYFARAKEASMATVAADAQLSASFYEKSAEIVGVSPITL